MPRTKKTDDNAILKMILEVIVNKGATTFSLEDLSAKTGLAPATLLQRFGSKKKILHQAIGLANQELKHGLMTKTAVRESALKQIIAIYIDFSAPFATAKDVAGGLDILKLDIMEKKLNELTKEYFAIRRDKIKSLIMLAQEQHEIAAKCNVEEIVWHLECLWQGSVLLWALLGSGRLSDWMGMRLKSYFDLLSDL